ncbi:hypothetical protein [Chroococcidiopsis sp. CCMEE 29]|uniref:hypothetical protein n=1 Tax=Chroococcidiopsis sp. CCMEE 29 TaxID=155894 RepID=UPI002021E54E|nr:hypothetical protein [Chroococcidiopsis sp. CCMEE 29]
MRTGEQGFAKKSTLHPEAQGDMAEMMAADKAYFEQHPYASQYYRKPFLVDISGFAPLLPPKAKIEKILVQRTDHRGVRARTPITQFGRGGVICLDQEL